MRYETELQRLFALLKQTFAKWNVDKAPALGAALAYYTVFSLAPLLIIAIGIAALFLGQDVAQGTDLRAGAATARGQRRRGGGRNRAILQPK
jgi:membrane protein